MRDVHDAEAGLRVVAGRVDVHGALPQDVATWPLLSDGRADQTQAAAPATIGEAKLVPVSTCDAVGRAVGSSAIGVSTGTASPGAATSTAALLLLNDAGASVWSDRGDAEDVRPGRRIVRRVALLGLVARRGDDERAGAVGGLDGAEQREALARASRS